MTAGSSFLITSVLIFIVFAVGGFVPFGFRSLLYVDGGIQMIDLFCWFKDVLLGRSSIDYTLAKSLGGSNFSVFSYYLASPLSLIVILFDKSQMPLFMNILFLLKSCLAASFMSLYLTERFAPSGKRQTVTTIILSVSYALSQFFISQSSNTMWLDGAYMLPLILMECERVLKGKKCTRLVIVFALTVCFNWYSGLIDMLFSGFWFLFGIVLNSSGKKLRDHFITIVRFGASCICSLLLSGMILVPTIMKLSGRTHGHAGLSMLTDLGMIGSVKDTVLNYSFGMICLKGSVSLFAGSFVLTGVFLLFAAGSQKLKEKLVCGSLLVFTVLIFIWQPLVALFSMLRIVESFWYRYSYVGAFILVFLASAFYLGSSRQKLRMWMPLLFSGIFSLITIVLVLITPGRLEDQVFLLSFQEFMPGSSDSSTFLIGCKILFPVLISLFLCLMIAAEKKNAALRKVSAGLLIASVATELVAGQVILSMFYSTDDAYCITDYVKNEESLLSGINDDSFYRILQTSYHTAHVSGLPASYNEPMAFGFNSVTSFVSDPDEDTILFMDNAGYAAHSETITVTPSENLALDSLMGVKYVMLPSGSTETSGLERLSGIDGFKDLYRNPYDLPVAFVYEGSGDIDNSSTCPAEYLNDLYLRLTGIEDLFIPVSYSSCEDGNDIVWSVDLGDSYSSDRYILYFNALTGNEISSSLLINGEFYTKYSQYMAPSMVKICTEENTVEITLRSDVSGQPVIVTDVQLYLLDLEKLEEASATAQAHSVTDFVLEDGYGRFTVSDGHANESLFVSVPVENGWTVTRNGHEVSCAKIGNALMSVPLEDGQNIIEMRYSLPYKIEGIITSISGAVLFAGFIFLEKISTRRPSKTHRGGKKHN